MAPSPYGRFRRQTARALGLSLLLLNSLGGCAALTNPIADGIPVHRLPPEFLEKPKDGEATIPLTRLGQDAPAVYRLAAGDVLGVWVETVLGDKQTPPPVTAPVQLLSPGQRRFPPSMGYPIPVREDGTVNLPLIDPVPVQGLSVSQAEEAVRAAYTKKQILPAGRERVFVSLMYPRQYHVLVLRQESSNIQLGPDVGVAGGKRGTGQVLDLPAYENDVLHALTETGGLPGLDACNQVVIFRRCFRGPQDRPVIEEKLRAFPAAGPLPDLGGPIVKIPLRLHPGEPLPLRPEEVILQNGDVVFLEARDHDVFYTAGLLPSGEFVLPRDRDLDVVEAISRVKGPMVNGAINTNNLSGTIVAPDLGSPSPSLLVVLRKTPGGGQVPIRVDLNRALRDARERILVRPGDTLVLQERPCDAVARYFTQTFLNFSLSWQAIHDRFITGVVDVASPSRLSGNRITVGSVTTR